MVYGFEPGGGEILRCSFCNRDQADVNRLVAGPTVFICDGCIRTCQEILAGPAGDAAPPDDSGDFRKFRDLYFSSEGAAWLSEQRRAEEERARRLGIQRYSVDFGNLNQDQFQAISAAALTVGAPLPYVTEYSSRRSTERHWYERDQQRRHIEIRSSLEQRNFQLVVADVDGREQVEEFPDIVSALDREMEFDHQWKREGWTETTHVE